MTGSARADTPREGGDASRAADAAGRAASQSLYAEVSQLQQRTDFSGQACRTPIRPGEIPMMLAGERSDGCTVAPASRGDIPPRDSAPGSARGAESGSLELNTEQLYRQALRETVRIVTRVQTPEGQIPSQGSGVVVDRNGGQCLIATSGHVVTNFPRTQIQSRGVQMPDGNIYPAEVRLNDRVNDRAILAINMGANSERYCTPARIGEGPHAGERGWTTGFPQHSRTMMVSPTEVTSVERSNERTLAGNRDVTLANMRSQTWGGNSGGPVYNSRGEVISLVRGGPNPADDPEAAIRETTGNPVTRDLIRSYVQRVRNQR